jgi:hypothetical protein
MPAAPTPHSTEAVDTLARDKINGLRGEFHEFREEVKADVGSLRSEIGAGFSKVFSRLDSDTRANMQASKSGLGIIASFALGVVGLAFSFTTLITQPLRDADNRFTEQDERQGDHFSKLQEADGELKAKLGVLELVAERNRELAIRLADMQKENTALNYAQGVQAARVEGELRAVRDQLRDIDSQGPRVSGKED